MIIPTINVHTDDVMFVRCLPPILLQEGGNDDDKHDSGGRTSRGITQREYNAYRRLNGFPQRDVWQADWSEIFDIYFRNYWTPVCPKLWLGLNLMYFDQAVNQGAVQAARNVQRAINNFVDPSLSGKLLRIFGLKRSTVAVDGQIGIVTLDALDRLKGNRPFLEVYYKQDLSFYHSLRNFFRYGKGWSARALSIYKMAVAFSTGG